MSVKEKVEEKVEEIEEKAASPVEKPEPALLTCRELEQVIDRRVRRVLCSVLTDACLILVFVAAITAIFEV